jgi:hypothetical protein
VSPGTISPYSALQRHYYTFGPESHPAPGTVLDSQGGYDGTVTGGTWVADNPPENAGGWRKTANGNNVSIPVRVNLLEGTYEGWFKTDASTPDWQNPLATSIRDVNEAHADDSMRIEIVNSATYGYDTRVYDAPGAGSLSTGVSTADGLWHLLALRYKDGEPVQLYIDGSLAGQTGGNYSALLAYDRGFTMLGSRAASGANGWRGTVGTLAYYNVALSADTLWRHYQGGIPLVAPEPSTLLIWSLVGTLAVLVLPRRRRGGAG